jgi:hypothetical protein
MVRVWAFVVFVLVALGFAAWASDFVTMQGERTVYTVDCKNGAWQGDHCSGQVAAGTRYRYRALKPHGEVIFWTVGTSEPSGKFNECTIQDGRNWVCKVCPRCCALDHAADGARRSRQRRAGRDAPVPGRLEVALAAVAARLYRRPRRSGSGTDELARAGAPRSQLRRRRLIRPTRPRPRPNSIQVSGSGIVATRKSCCRPFSSTSMRASAL